MKYITDLNKYFASSRLILLSKIPFQLKMYSFAKENATSFWKYYGYQIASGSLFTSRLIKYRILNNSN